MTKNQYTVTFGPTAFVTALVLIVAALLVSPVAAQQEFSRTLTEQEINNNYRVANPRRAALSNVVVDLQTGQAVITADHATRNRGTITTTSVMQPYVESGRIYWTMTSVTVNGEPASEELVAQVNTAIASSWRNYIQGKFEGVVDTIIITDTDLTLTGVLSGERADGFADRMEQGVENGTVNEDDTPRLFGWFQRRNP
jgi:hypothetical protein